MKKNISINISGIIFHIEEDGYDELKRYLDSIHRYFSSFDDSSEILADIESRIAEIFLSKLSEEKQVITREDVHALIATMGSVSDFRAEETRNNGETEEDQEQASSSTGWEGFAPPRKLWRDEKRKILGGVCAGLGNYFEVDPLWFRLIFAALLPAGGFIVLLYIILWIVIPASWELDDPVKGKKLFRDPQSKVLGGVSGGIAAYLGIDIVIVRVLFIALIFAGGFGVLLYILLWVIVPEAVTITDRMQMQGEPVTLSNIESTIKRKLNIREGETESTLSKIILFPFRLIGQVLTALAEVIGPIGHIVRVAAGVFLVLVGFALVLSALMLAGVALGVFVGVPAWLPGLSHANLPWDAFTAAIPAWLVLASVVALAVPALFVILLGASLIARRRVFTSAVGWSFLAVFLISVAALAVGIPAMVYAFHEDGDHRIETVYPVPDVEALVLQLGGAGSDYEAVRLRLRGHDQDNIKLQQVFKAQGANPGQASENARMVDYRVAFADSVLTFDRALQFREDAVFRGQRLDMTLYLPYEQPFVMTGGISRIVSQYVSDEHRDGFTWQMTADGLDCLDCNDGEDNTSSLQSMRDFNAINITGRFDLRIGTGESYSVEMRGQHPGYSIKREGTTLVIDYDRRDHIRWTDWGAIDDNWNLAIDEVALTVTLPDLERLEATGMGRLRLDSVSADNLRLETRGPVRLRGEIECESLNLRLVGRGDAVLSGRVGELDARLEFASRLRGEGLTASDARVETVAASRADVHVTGTLEMDEGVASRIHYSGNPRIIHR